jgi:type IV secretion system protein VirB4
MLHTLNLADMLPITSVWAGLRENPSAMMPKHSPPLLFAATSGATPFRVNLHVSDLGHTLIVGPSGAGKSNREMALLKHMFNIAERWGQHQGANPVRLVRFLPEDNLHFETQARSRSKGCFWPRRLIFGT